MTTTKTLALHLYNIPTSARTAHRMSHIHINFVAISTLCDADCEITLNKHMITVEHNG